MRYTQKKLWSGLGLPGTEAKDGAMRVRATTAQKVTTQSTAESSFCWNVVGYLGQLGVWGAVEGGYSVHISLLTGQETQGTSHTEPHAPHLQCTTPRALDTVLDLLSVLAPSSLSVQIGLLANTNYLWKGLLHWAPILSRHPL